MGLDQNYSASAAEKDYVKNTLETEGVQSLFKKEAQGLQSKIINNFHSTNYSLFESQKKLDKHGMIETINSDPDMKAKYEAALAKNKGKGGFSEGILLLQTLAIKCVTVLSNNEIVENKLQQRSDLGHKSEAMDGILGPNTFYVLASIAKEKNIPFNGVVDQKLIDTIVDICLEDALTKPAEDTKQEQISAEVVIPENPAIIDDKPAEVVEEKKENGEEKTEEKKEEEKINNTPTEITLLENIGTIETTDIGYNIYITEPKTYQQFSESSKNTLHRLEEQGYIISYISKTKNDVISTIEITKNKKVLKDFEEFEAKKTKLKDIIEGKEKGVKKWLNSKTQQELKKYDYKLCSFTETQDEDKITETISYNGKKIVEIGIGIHEKEIRYFVSYELKGEWVTKRTDKGEIPKQTRINSLILQKIEELVNQK